MKRIDFDYFMNRFRPLAGDVEKVVEQQAVIIRLLTDIRASLENDKPKLNQPDDVPEQFINVE